MKRNRRSKQIGLRRHMSDFVDSLGTEHLKWLATRISEELDRRRLSDTLDPINYKVLEGS